MSTLKDKAQSILDEKELKILPENIKEGVQIFDVIGEYQGSGGSGDVKLFDTVEQMQEDEDAQAGDLAVVYEKLLQPITATTEFDSCVFPNEVVLDSAVGNEIYGDFRAVDMESWFQGQFSLSSSSFSFTAFGEDVIHIEYESADGITYTRTDGGEELVEFETAIKYDEGYEPWNNLVGNFMKISNETFGGMYKFKNNVDTTRLRTISLSNISYDYDTALRQFNSHNFNGIYTNADLPIDKLEALKNKFYEGNYKQSLYIIQDSNGVYRLLDIPRNNLSNWFVGRCIDYATGDYIGICLTLAIGYESDLAVDIYELDFTKGIDDGLYTFERSITTENYIRNNSLTHYILPLSSVIVPLELSKSYGYTVNDTILAVYTEFHTLVAESNIHTFPNIYYGRYLRVDE